MLIYSAIASLDGYIEDEDGRFDWAEPDEEVHAFVNDLARPVGTYLYGRRMYEVMLGWETDPSLAEQLARHARTSPRSGRRPTRSCTRGRWRRSRPQRTRIEREFDPDAVRRLKAAAGRDLAVGGAELAAQAFRAGLVDECHLFVAPIVVGGGKRALPDEVRLALELLDERRFGNGMVYLRYRTALALR